jgi:hypothetical protein
MQAVSIIIPADIRIAALKPYCLGSDAVLEENFD